MNKTYAFGFLIVLLVIILGMYVALTSFRSTRDALRAQAALSEDTPTSEGSTSPTLPAPTPTETIMVIPTPLPGITATLTAMASAASSESPTPTEPPAPAPTQPPPTQPAPIQPTSTPAQEVRPPTPVPAPAYQFRLAGPPGPDPSYSICCYLFGTVRDATGTGLEGVRIQAFNEWNTLEPAVSKGGGEAGQYNIPIGRDLVNWYIMVVDGAGNQISSQVQIQFDPNAANGYRVDWQRAY
jgi:hypothetical protein